MKGPLKSLLKKFNYNAELLFNHNNIIRNKAELINEYNIIRNNPDLIHDYSNII